MIVINRFRVGDAEATSFRDALGEAVEALAQRPGFESADTGRNVDDPTLWSLVTRWQDIGSYRRALSAYEVKMTAVPLLSRALDEPSAYEPLTGELNVNLPR